MAILKKFGKVIGVSIACLICGFTLMGAIAKEPIHTSPNTYIQFLGIQSWGIYKDETIGCGPQVTTIVEENVYGPIAIGWTHH